MLANVWYRYLPHLIVDSYGNGCSIDRTGSVTCEAAQIVNQVNDEELSGRALASISDGRSPSAN